MAPDRVFEYPSAAQAIDGVVSMVATGQCRARQSLSWYENGAGCGSASVSTCGSYAKRNAFGAGQGSQTLRMLYLLLYPLHTEFSFLNVFRYLSFRIIYVAAVTAFLLAFVLAPPLIRKLQEIKLGQNIRDDGPSRHQTKSGTPTMGGLLIIFAVVLSTLLWADLTNHYIWLAVLATVGFGLVGFADDYIKFVGKRSKGLTASQKFLAQGMVALAIGMFFYFLPGYSTQLSVPFFKSFTPDLGWLYIPLRSWSSSARRMP